MQSATAESTATVRQAVAHARSGAEQWAATPIRRRLEILSRVRQRIGDEPMALAATAQPPWRAGAAETLTAEILPLLDAIRFLERTAPKVLAPRRTGRRGRPAWLFGAALEIHRDPLGVVLIIGPSNYPVLLAGVQSMQALAAGNAVVVKAGSGGRDAMLFLARQLAAEGLPNGLFQVLSEEVEDARQAIAAGVDKVLLTGSFKTGREVSGQLAESATPLVAELSGCDAVIILADADLDLAARGVAFGMTLNGGFTCIAPRRLLVAAERAEAFEKLLAERLGELPPVDLTVPTRQRLGRLVEEAISQGGRIAAGSATHDEDCPVLLADLPNESLMVAAEVAAPVAALFPVQSEEEALRRVRECPYRLGVSVFGSPRRAGRIARRLDAGVVVVNDMIVPTADPRAPFGGRGRSGHGTTRGAEGLLEVTAPKAIATRSGTFRPHFDPTTEADRGLFESFVRAAHGSTLGRRWSAAVNLLKAARSRRSSAS